MKKPSLTQEFTSQELNGLTDWFSSAVNTVSNSVADAALWVTEATGTTSSVLAFTDNIDAASKRHLDTFQASVNKLLGTQKQVDEGIESMPPSPDRQRLEALRMQSRGMFNTYILPAWNSFKNWAQIENKANYSGYFSGFGALPVVGLAAVIGGIVVATKYINSAQAIEEQILRDPALAKTYVASRGTLFSLGSMPTVLTVGALGLGAFYLLSSKGLLSKDKNTQEIN